MSCRGGVGWDGSCRGGVGWVKTQTQKIITHRVLKIHKWISGDVYEQGQSFLSHDK